MVRLPVCRVGVSGATTCVDCASHCGSCSCSGVWFQSPAIVCELLAPSAMIVSAMLCCMLSSWS